MSAAERSQAEPRILASFSLGAHEFAVDVRHVQEVVRRPAALLQLPLQPDWLEGVFNLRGRIIPLLRTGQLLGWQAHAGSSDGRVAIVHHRGLRLGLQCDDTRRLLRPRAQDLVALQFTGESTPAVVSAVLRLADALVALVDLDRLIGLQNLPHAAHAGGEESFLLEKLRRRRCITFRVGAARMAFPIGEIHEILPARPIEESPVRDHLTAGLLRVRDRVVPIVQFGRVLGAGDMPTDPSQPDARVIVLDLAGQHVGLLVDSVDAIETYTADQCLAVPALSHQSTGFHGGCIDFGERGFAVLLNPAGVLREEEVARVTGQHSALFGSGSSNRNSARCASGREALLSFRAGLGFAIAMRDIREIVNPRQGILPLPGAPNFMLGMLNLRGRMVPVVDLRSFYRLPAAVGGEEEAPKVLVIDHPRGVIGLHVDTVRSIVHVLDTDRLPVPALLRATLPPSIRQDMREIVHPREACDKGVDLLLLDVSRVVEALHSLEDPQALAGC